MIGRGTVGKSFSGCDQYLSTKDKSREIGRSLVMGEKPKEIYKEVEAISNLKPNVKKNVFHVSLSLKPGEKLNDVTWNKIAVEYMQKMGFTDNQYLIYRHADTDKDHIHIVANRIRLDGSVVNDSNSYKRSMDIIRGLEKKHNLEMVKTDYNKTITPEEYKLAELEGRLSLKLELQSTLKELTADKPNMDELINRLSNDGVYMKFRFRNNGEVAGLSYITERGIIKASDVGKAYTFSGLQNRKGVGYVKIRDYKEIIRIDEYAASYEKDRNDRAIESSNLRDVVLDQGVSNSHQRDGVEHRGADFSLNQGDGLGEGIDERRGRDHGEYTSGVEGRESEILEFSSDRGADSREKVPEGRSEKSDLVVDDSSRIINDNLDNIFDLVQIQREPGERGPHQLSDLAGSESERLVGTGKREDPARFPGKNTERLQYNPKEDFKAQIDAVGANRFEIFLHNIKTGENKVLEYTPEDLKKQYDRLQIENAKGFNISIRSGDVSGNIVLEKVNDQDIVKMKNDGLRPSLVVETRGKKQVLIRLSRDEISSDIKKEAFGALAERYKGSESHDGFVRAVGFRVHTKSTQKSITKLVEGVQRIADNGIKLLLNVADRLHLRSYDQKHNSRIGDIQKFKDNNPEGYSFKEYYKMRFKEEFGKGQVLRELKKVDLSSQVDIFNFQEGQRTKRIFSLGISQDTIRKVNISDYFSKINRIDLMIAGELKENGVNGKDILNTIKSVSPSFAGKNKALEGKLEKNLGLGLGRGLSR